MLEAWKKMKVESENETSLGASRESLLAQESKLKDRLFIEFGEDVDDAFAAFKFYELDTNITEEDRKRYGKQ